MVFVIRFSDSLYTDDETFKPLSNIANKNRTPVLRTPYNMVIAGIYNIFIGFQLFFPVHT